MNPVILLFKKMIMVQVKRMNIRLECNSLTTYLIIIFKE